MHQETAERLQRIRSKIQEGRAALAKLKVQLADNTDKQVNQLVQQASSRFDDIGVFFLGILKDERVPPRTLADESRVLDEAESFLERVAVEQLKTLQDMVAKLRPNLES